MRRVPALLIALFLLPACGGEPSPTSRRPATREALARLAFDALQAHDFERLRPALPTAADHRWMVERMAERASPSLAEGMREITAKMGGAEGVAEWMAERLQASFDEVFAAAAERLTWSESRFGGMLEHLSVFAERDGIDLADVVFSVEHGGERLRVLVDDVMKTPGGCVVAGRFVFDPSPFDNLPMARAELAEIRLSQLESAVRMYYLRHRSLPEDVAVLMEVDERIGEPLLGPDFVDPWDNEFRIEHLSRRDFRLLSNGPDGAVDTEDDIVWPPPDGK